MTNQSLASSLKAIDRLVEGRGPGPLWIEDGSVRTWRDFAGGVASARRECESAGVQPGHTVVIPADSGFDTLVWLFAVASVGATVAPMRRERAGELQRWREFVSIDWQVHDSRLSKGGGGETSASTAMLQAELARRGHRGLILATGGTTGVPKVVLLDLDRLLEEVPCKRGRSWRVMPLMLFDHIGGLDMGWRALAGGQVLVAPPDPLSTAAVIDNVARHGVEVLPATPSFLNLLLLAEAPRIAELRSLRVIAYGAEPMPPAVLVRLRELLPDVELVQRFGSSETGVIPARPHGAGLQLDDSQGRSEWKIVEGELWIRSPARAVGYLSGGNGGLTEDGWFRTGDIAEPLDGPGVVRILGRRDELINVGGEKILPATVENLLLAHPMVADCRAYAAPNRVLGQVVAVEVLWLGPETDPVHVKHALHAFARSSPKSHLPVTVRLVSAIDTTRNLKKRRFPQ